MGLATTIASVIAGYLLGSIPFAYGVTRWRKGADIRTLGDGNPGAANVFRQVGKGAGIAVFLLDAAKGAAAVALALIVTPDAWVPYLAGATAVAGHNWPLFLGFRGGRGAATAAGVLAVFLPQFLPLILLLAAVPFLAGQRAALVLTLILLPLPPMLWWLGVSLSTIAYGAALSIFVGIAPRLRLGKS